MKILIVNNASLNSEKFKIQNELLFNSATDMGIELDMRKNTEILYELYDNQNNLSNYDAVLFYDKDILLCKKLESLGLKVFNSSDCIYNCDNKALTYQILEKNKLPIPKTIILPMLFYYNKELLTNYIEHIKNTLGFPLIAKKWFGSEGQQVYLINNQVELENLIDTEQGKELLFQHFYEECFGSDIRVNLVNHQIVACMKRTSQNGDFRSNLSNGGTAKQCELTNEEKQIAILASKALNCSFCGIDILQTKNGPIICEVNSNAHLKNIYNITNVNVAKLILEYIKNQI